MIIYVSNLTTLMDRTAACERISIYPMDQSADKRKRLMSALEELGISYTYEAY